MRGARNRLPQRYRYFVLRRARLIDTLWMSAAAKGIPAKSAKKAWHCEAGGTPSLTRFLRRLDGRGPTHGWGWLDLPACPDSGWRSVRQKLRKMGRMCEMFHVEHIVITSGPYSNVMTDKVFKKAKLRAFMWWNLAFNGKGLSPISSKICAFTATGGCSCC